MVSTGGPNYERVLEMNESPMDYVRIRFANRFLRQSIPPPSAPRTRLTKALGSGVTVTLKCLRPYDLKDTGIPHSWAGLFAESRKMSISTHYEQVKEF